MRLKRPPNIIPETSVKFDADPIFLHFAIASLIFAIIGAVGAILSDGFEIMLETSHLFCWNFVLLNFRTEQHL